MITVSLGQGIHSGTILWRKGCSQESRADNGSDKGGKMEKWVYVCVCVWQGQLGTASVLNGSDTKTLPQLLSECCGTRLCLQQLFEGASSMANCYKNTSGNSCSLQFRQAHLHALMWLGKKAPPFFLLGKLRVSHRFCPCSSVSHAPLPACHNNRAVLVIIHIFK